VVLALAVAAGFRHQARMIDPPAHEPLRARLMRWLRRYGVAEIVAILASYAGWFGAAALGAGLIAAGYASALAENFGFYGAMALTAWRAAPPGGRRRALALLLVEFGPAELLDSLLIRPLAVSGAVALLGAGAGVLVGKLLGDALFYLIAIASHEWLRRR
jgi:hypothetical protein